MAESKTFKILNITFIFTKDESITDGMILVDIDGKIELITVKEFSELFDNILNLKAKIIKYSMNTKSETIFMPLQEKSLRRFQELLAEYNKEKETKRQLVNEVKKKLSTELKKIDALVADTVGFNVETIIDIENEIEKLNALKKTKSGGLEKFIAKFNSLNASIVKKHSELFELFELYDKNIDKIMDKSVDDKLFFRPLMDPDLKSVLMTLEYVSEFDKVTKKQKTVYNDQLAEVYTKLESLAELINKMSAAALAAAAAAASAAAASAAAASAAAASASASAASTVQAEKRARMPSVESEGVAAESAHQKGLLFVKKANLVAPPVPRHPVVLEKKARHAEGEVVNLDLETAKDVLRFVVEHDHILKRKIEDARLGMIRTRLAIIAGLSAAELVAASPEINAALKQVISFRDEVIHQPFVVEATGAWKEAEESYKLLALASLEAGPCSGGGAGSCAEAESAATAMRKLELRRVKLIEAEAAVLETLFAQIDADHEIARAAERDGWVPLRYKVANYMEFVEHIRRQAVANGLIVINGTPKDPSRDPRPAIYIQTTARTPLHLTLSPDVLTSGKFHMTHNGLPKELKHFYFSIRYDPGNEVPFIVKDGTSERIEIDQIAQIFIAELTKQELPTEQIKEEVRHLLKFLMSNMDTQSTKKRGGYYEKYMKYKLKYLRLKAFGI